MRASTRQRQAVVIKISGKPLVFHGAASSMAEQLFVGRPLIIHNNIRDENTKNCILSSVELSMINPLMSMRRPNIIFQQQVVLWECILKIRVTPTIPLKNDM